MCFIVLFLCIYSIFQCIDVQADASIIQKRQTQFQRQIQLSGNVDTQGLIGFASNLQNLASNILNKVQKGGEIGISAHISSNGPPSGFGSENYQQFGPNQQQFAEGSQFMGPPDLNNQQQFGGPPPHGGPPPPPRGPPQHFGDHQNHQQFDGNGFGFQQQQFGGPPPHPGFDHPPPPPPPEFGHQHGHHHGHHHGPPRPPPPPGFHGQNGFGHPPPPPPAGNWHHPPNHPYPQNSFNEFVHHHGHHHGSPPRPPPPGFDGQTGFDHPPPPPPDGNWLHPPNHPYPQNSFNEFNQQGQQEKPATQPPKSMPLSTTENTRSPLKDDNESHVAGYIDGIPVILLDKENDIR